MLSSTFSHPALPVALLVFAAGCNSGNTDAGPQQSSSAEAPIETALAYAKVSNPTQFDRTQEPLRFPIYDLGLQAGDSRIAQLVVKDGDQLVPSQLIDSSADNQVDTLLVAADLSGGQTRTFKILADADAAESLNIPKQTQAEISHKTGGEWQDAKYVGGEFQNVAQLTPPTQYTDHSEWIRYEGPGIESDKVGYRIYLDWRNGFDIFGKNTSQMVLQDVGLDGYQSYHEPAEWGMDILKVGKSLGMGGYGFWNGEQVELVSEVDTRKVTIVEDGPLYSDLQIAYQGWVVNDQKLDLTANLAMNAGSRLVHTRLQLSDELPNIAIGVVKHPGTELIQGPEDISGYAWTYTASWGEQTLSEENPKLGMAIIYRRGDKDSQTQDENSYVSLMKAPGGELEYYFLAAWEGEKEGITTKEEFITYLDQEIDRLTLTPRVRFDTKLSQETRNQPLTAASALAWSKRLADSELARKTLSYNFDGWDINRRRPPKFEYDIVGLLPMAYDELNKVAPDADYAEVPHKTTATFITEKGDIQRYKISNYNIDAIKPGDVVLRLHDATGDEKYKQAADLLRRQLEEHPRTSEGAFWHKKTYPHQVWLDGVYMGMPFLAEYSARFEGGASWEDVVKEFEITYHRLRDPETGLYYHAWDESKQMGWADPETGLSPHFWARGMGWYAMALVDVLDSIPAEETELRAPLLTAITDLAPALVDTQDPETGTWFQIIDQPERIGNYRESTATAMFSYFFAKALRKGYLPETYRPAALKAFQGLIDEFVTVHPDGRISMTNQCLVAGLGFGRDGSYRYYMGERIFENDPKGTGPFILAGIEMHRLLQD